MPFAAFSAPFFGNVLVVPSTPGPPCQQPGALGTAKAWSRYQELRLTKAESLSLGSQSWSFTLSREASAFRLQGLARQHVGLMELGSPGLSIMIPSVCGDVKQPCKPVVILKHFDNVLLSFNVTCPCVCSSVIERDIGQI